MDQPTKPTKTQLKALKKRLDLPDLEAAAALIAGYPKPLWYINYRLETGQDLEAKIPRIEQ